jgi:hypothetical protein
MSGNSGSGPSLDVDFDFVVDTTGDIESSSNVEELGKDLSIRMALNLEQYIGQPPTNLLKQKVATTATKVALADTRVRGVDRDSTKVSFDDTLDEITVQMKVFTEDGEQELVFNV